MMTTLLEVLELLGRATWSPVWVPMLAWTGFTIPLWMLLRWTDRLHPNAEYRLLQVLLAGLPLGILAVNVVNFLPESASPPTLPSASVVVLPTVKAMEPASSPPTWHWIQAVGLLTAGALATGLFQLGRLLLEGVATVRLRQRMVSSPSSVQEEVERLSEQLNLRRRVKGCVTPEAVVPMTLGGIQPMILLPPTLTEKSAALNTTLLHECIHIRRWDDLAHIAERAIAALFVVHPFVEPLRQSIVAARERACDAAVLGDAHTTPASYARLLLAFADPSETNPLGALSLSESPTSLKDRLSAMQLPSACALSSRKTLGGALLGLALLMTLGVVACSDSVGPTSPPPESQESESSPQSSEEAPVYMVVDEQPDCGGIKALQQNVKYPEFAKKAGIEGRVFVQFIVDKQGEVTNPKITRGVHKLLNEAALKAVNRLECTPGHLQEEPVQVQMSLPVSFRLPEQPSSDTPPES